jgi:hypothetical protein
MRIRLIAALTLVSGTAAVAQEAVNYTYNFVETVAGTTNPATGPNAGNGILEPGESARLRISLLVTPNIGTTTTYPPPPPPRASSADSAHPSSI